MWRERGRTGVRWSLLASLAAAIAVPAWAWPPMCVWRIEASDATLAPDEDAAVTPSEVFPHVRVDASAGMVEFDGQIAINAHAQDGSVVFLEAIVCRPDTKEHESLVVTRALASHVHAALLLLGLEPGTPGGWRWEDATLVDVPPEGPGLRVTLSWTDESGTACEHDATDLIERRGDRQRFTEFLGEGTPAHVFAGSRFVDRGGGEVYDADGAGLVVGLHTFGSEVVALRRVLSHEASVLEPEWIARREVVPVRGTPVVVRLRVEATP